MKNELAGIKVGELDGFLLLDPVLENADILTLLFLKSGLDLRICKNIIRLALNSKTISIFSTVLQVKQGQGSHPKPLCGLDRSSKRNPANLSVTKRSINVLGSVAFQADVVGVETRS